MSQHAIHLHDIRGDVTPDQLMKIMKENPHLLMQLQSADPELHAAVTKDIATLRLLMMRRQMSQHKMIFDRREELRKLQSDPDNADAQARIAEEIRLANVRENMELAMEEMPEAYGRVYMLYIDLEVNSIPLKAFIDSGAQSTIMSVRCAEKCNLMRFIDRQFAGEARGVGTAKILGRVHMTQMKMGNSYFPISVTILETNDIDFLFGLDMLKRHRCVIDLAKNVLRVEGSTGIEETPFLSEKDLIEANSSGIFSEKPAASSSGTVTEDMKMDVTSSESKREPETTTLSNSMNDKIAHLIGLGFSDVDALAALQKCGEDLELAASILFNGSS